MNKGTIGIIGAMDVEVEGIIARIDGAEERTVGGIKFTSGKIDGRDVVVAQSGMGKVAAAACAQTMIVAYSPVCVINTGIAGSLSRDIGLLDIVIAERTVQHDFDLTSWGYHIGEIQDVGLFMECDPSICRGLSAAADSLGIKNVIGTVASGDSFIADDDKKAWIHDTFSASACEMEGAAIGQVCVMRGVPYCVLRTISDGGDDDAKMTYETFKPIAAKQSVDVMTEFLKSL